VSYQEIVRKVLREYDLKRQVVESKARDLKIKLYEKYPALAELDKEIASIGASMSISIIKNPEKADEIKKESYEKMKAISIKRDQILKEIGISNEQLEPDYECPICKDTGFIDSEKCKCFTQRIIDEVYQLSSLKENIKHCTFENFDFTLFSDEPYMTDKGPKPSPLENMKVIYKRCKEFVENFDTATRGLFFVGKTGLGKTYLSYCIANELMARGKTVIYQTAFTLFDIMHESRFDSEKSRSEILANILECDLLIIDDLGTEFSKKIAKTELFNILNTRLIHKRKTVISTNHSLSEINEMYEDRVISRMSESFDFYNFYGNDVRFILRQREPSKKASE